VRVCRSSRPTRSFVKNPVICWVAARKTWPALVGRPPSTRPTCWRKSSDYLAWSVLGLLMRERRIQRQNVGGKGFHIAQSDRSDHTGLSEVQEGGTTAA
jgi:hypothetical protein